MRFQRHIEVHVAKHLEKIAGELKRLVQAQRCQLAIGGQEEIVDELLQKLPQPIAEKFIGRFPINHKHDTERQILERAEAVWQQREQFESGKRVDQVLDAAKSKDRGVVGVEPTLSALSQEKVRVFLLADGVAIQGTACLRCDYFSSQPFESCPVCGGEAQHRDLTDRAVEKALLTGASAEVVADSPSRDRLLAEGGVGALLWY
jgi:peptide subunit release factor 1 (eRF1)